MIVKVTLQKRQRVPRRQGVGKRSFCIQIKGNFIVPKTLKNSVGILRNVTAHHLDVAVESAFFDVSVDKLRQALCFTITIGRHAEYKLVVLGGFFFDFSTAEKSVKNLRGQRAFWRAKIFLLKLFAKFLANVFDGKRNGIIKQRAFGFLRVYKRRRCNGDLATVLNKFF